MRISDWSSDVCSSDLVAARPVEIPLADLQWVLAEGEGDLLDDALATDHALRAAKAAKRRVRAGVGLQRQRGEAHIGKIVAVVGVEQRAVGNRAGEDGRGNV